MESMIQDMLPGDLSSGADGVEPMSRGEHHMSKVEAAAILGRMAATSWVTVDEVTALEMGARRLMNRHFQRQRNWARRHARHVPPLSPEEELADTIARQKEGK